nr:immunoglobulin heavy chain junction region [Mus musculus]
CASDLKRSSFW